MKWLLILFIFFCRCDNKNAEPKTRAELNSELKQSEEKLAEIMNNEFLFIARMIKLDSLLGEQIIFDTTTFCHVLYDYYIATPLTNNKDSLSLAIELIADEICASKKTENCGSGKINSIVYLYRSEKYYKIGKWFAMATSVYQKGAHVYLTLQ